MLWDQTKPPRMFSHPAVHCWSSLQCQLHGVCALCFCSNLQSGWVHKATADTAADSFCNTRQLITSHVCISYILVFDCRSTGTAEPGERIPGWLCGVRTEPNRDITAAQYERRAITHVCNARWTNSAPLLGRYLWWLQPGAAECPGQILFPFRYSNRQQ
jgi:hypothetical protein